MGIAAMKFMRVGMMPWALALLTLLAALVLPGQAAEPAEEGPIDRVVSLLKELEADLEKDEKAEQDIYDKYACWCEETTARKAKDIEDAKEAIQRLGQDILKQKGIVAVRTDEIADLNKRIKENLEAQAALTESRKKENAAWQAESQETSEAMTAINTAMDILVKATKPALLQQDATAKLQASVSAAVSAAPAKALAALDPAKLTQLRSFLQARGKVNYAPQSMTIQGILSDMYKTMGVDLQDSTVAEAEANRKFEDYIAEKQKELKDMQKTLIKKEMQKTEAEAMLAEATEAYDVTTKQLEADTEFFDATKKACKEKTDEWSERSSLRKEEIEGIKKALEILTSDEAKDLFAKSIKPGLETTFLQLDAVVVPAGKKQQFALEKVFGKLKEKASRSHSLRLAAVAAKVRMAKAGHFDEVIKAIDELIKVLGEEQVKDDKIKAYCEGKRQELASKIADIEWKITNNEAMIEKLEKLIELREKEKEETIKEIEKTEKEIKDMKDKRKEENEEFKQAKKDDEDSIKILKEAREALIEYYKKHDVKMGETQGSVKGKFLQEDPMSDPDKAPDANFSGKGKRKGQAKGVVSILTMVIEDLGGEIANGITAEEAAQAAFEEALAAAEKLLKALEAKKVSLEEKIAKRKKDKEDEEKDKEANEKDLKEEEDFKAKIKKDCDYMVGDAEAGTTGEYSKRRENREAEREALVDAKEFLATYYDSEEAESSFVQSPPSHVKFSSISFNHVN